MWIRVQVVDKGVHKVWVWVQGVVKGIGCG